MSKTETQSEALRLADRLEGHAPMATRDQAAAELRRLDAENKALRVLAATCYAGLGAECNLPENWLDAMNAAANGEAFDTEGLLPFTAGTVAAPSAGWISVDVALPPKNTEVAIWFAESTIPSTGQYTGLRADPNGWSYPSENYPSPGEHPNHPEGGYPTVTHWMELHAPGAAQAKEGGA